MGGRGSSSNKEISIANRIRGEVIETAMSSRMKGLARQAREGAGSFAFKNAKAVSAKQIESLPGWTTYERGGNTVISSTKNGRTVFYANRSDSPEIQRLKRIQADRAKREEERIQEDQRKTASLQGARTSTFDRWEKRNRSKFDSWFNGGK